MRGQEATAWPTQSCTSESTPSRPWAVSRADLGAFADERMREVAFEEGTGLSGRPFLQVVYERSSA